MKKTFLFIFLLFIISFITYRIGLNFSFLKDDWNYLWVALYDPRYLLSGVLLHPATNFEFFILAKLFGINTTLWQGVGLLLKIIASFSVFLLSFKISQSKLSGFLAGIFFATCTAGLESVVWNSAHVVNTAVIFICFGFYYWLIYLEKKGIKNIIPVIIFLLFALFSDPWRAFPIFAFLFLSTLFFSKIKIRIKKIPILLSLLLAGVIFFYQKSVFLNLASVKFVFKNINNPSIFFEKSYIVGNFFNSIFNLFSSFLINQDHSVNEISHGIYNQLQVYFTLFLLLITGILIYIKRKKRETKMFLFFLIWILLFYLPNWFYETRLVVTQTHRYLVIPSVGFVYLIAFLISKLRNHLLIFLFSLIFIFLNINRSHILLSEMAKYRNTNIVEDVWQKIDESVALDNKPKVFLFMGDEPIKTNILDLSGPAPFALRRKISDTSELPIITHDTKQIVSFLCDKNPAYVFRGKLMPLKENLIIDHFYAFGIKNDGSLENISDRERKRIKIEANKIKCGI